MNKINLQNERQAKHMRLMNNKLTLTQNVKKIWIKADFGTLQKNWILLAGSSFGSFAQEKQGGWEAEINTTWKVELLGICWLLEPIMKKHLFIMTRQCRVWIMIVM